MLYNNKELLDDTDTLSIDTEDEYMRKEVLEVKNLDNLIRAMNDKVKVNCFSFCDEKPCIYFVVNGHALHILQKASEETLFYQCENRKRLDQILTLNPSETGKLAENTRQFLYLCPGYAMLNAGMAINKSITTVHSRYIFLICISNVIICIYTYNQTL